MLSLACFVILNVYGYTLWQSRDRLPAYTAIQRFLLATTVIYAVMVVCFNCRVVAAEQVPANGLNENMPYWVIGLPPVLMLFFFAQERGLRGSRTETTSQKNDDLDATEQHGKT